MGCYIYHSKFTLEKPEDGFGCELIESSFSQNDLILFEKYFQNVKTKKFIDSIILFNTSEEVYAEKIRLNFFNGIFNKNDYKSIDKYIRHKKYDKLLKEESILYDNRICISFYEIKIAFGYYMSSVFSHPLKDCHYEFHKKYKTGETYSNFEAFKDACNLEYDEYRFESKLDYDDRIQLFRQNLIDKFEYGKSILYFF
jgi:hypothetical protein